MENNKYEHYDVAIIGAGPGGYFAAYKLLQLNPNLKIKMYEEGNPLEKRACPISAGKVSKCVKCKTCSIMCGTGGAGAFSDGKFNITNDFGGTFWEKVGKKKSIELQQEVDKINESFFLKGGGNTYPKLFSSASSESRKYHKICLQNNLRLLDADIRHLGTDNNYLILTEIFKYLSSLVDISYNTKVETICKSEFGYSIYCSDVNLCCNANNVIIATGRAGSSWTHELCKKLDIPTISNRVDIGVRVELPFEVFSDLTDALYESKIVYKTQKYEDLVRTFCMNPKGIVVSENTNGLITVNGHSFEDDSKKTKNTNFALLVSQHFTDPFNDSNEYGESIVKLSNMLGGGVIVQRLGDLKRGKRSTKGRLRNSTVMPTLKAEPGDLSLVLPKRILDDVMEMLEALDKIAPGTASDDTLLYGVEVKYYNSEVEVNDSLCADSYPGVYFIGDSSGITHSLSQAAASGLYVAERIVKNMEVKKD